MRSIPLFGLGTQSTSTNVTAQTLVNMYLENTDEKGMVAYGRPGLSLFSSLGDTPIRGMYSIDNTEFYVVHKNVFYTINNSGIASNKGTISTSTGRVDMAHNGTQIIIVDGSTIGYIYTIASGVLTAIVDADYPGADTVAFNNGRFIVSKPNTGQYWLSASYNGASWVATDFATAESSPDNLVRVYVDHGELILFGTRTTEFAVDTGGLDFPYTRVSGATAEFGLAARWSVAKFNDSVIWLAQNRLGEYQVVKLNGYSPQKVSTNDIDRIINSYGDVSNATGLAYMHKGHAFYQLNFPSDGKSWLYDGLMDKWSELKYGSEGMHLSEMAIPFNGTIKTSSYSYGNIYTVDGDINTDNGIPIYSEITGKHISNMLDRMTIGSLQVDCETGEGLASDIEPQIMLQISRDNGHTWGTERWTGLGKVGKYSARAIWRRLGMSRDWVFRIRIVDDVRRVILGVWIN